MMTKPRNGIRPACPRPQKPAWAQSRRRPREIGNQRTPGKKVYGRFMQAISMASMAVSAETWAVIMSICALSIADRAA